ncbi:RNA methyltransferase [Kineosporia rhizophila]|uniref:TrmH family RNA methyltransferase n=1 Tax=Kineosporia TaxID=49184 RepID=UPI001E4809CC|nr:MULTISPECIES: RNA methyltransferase [Kineosporia]MCE0538399.1 RNA methyltransferase [Kineosporia rhizophila]GLY18541.1 RNA methyltransferase [Kineosporia sp. NBRC 101677]
MTTERPAPEALSNPRSDRVRAVARLSGRSARLRAGRFLVEGPQAVREAVAEQLARTNLKTSFTSDRRSAPEAPGGLRELYATPEAAQRHPEILHAAAEAGVPARPVTDEVLAAMLAGAGTTTPQGLLAVCDLITVPLETVLAARPRLVAVLSQVRDPGNAGTVIRAADAAGADAVVLTDASVDVHNPKCVRSTAGSLFHLPIVAGVPLAEAVQQLKAQGVSVLAADGAGKYDLDVLADDAEDRAVQPPTDRRPQTSVIGDPWLENPVAWVFGNEAWGLPETDRELADAVVRVPVHGRAESLNLGTAATVCLYATARAQRREQRRQERFTKADPAR